MTTNKFDPTQWLDKNVVASIEDVKGLLAPHKEQTMKADISAQNEKIIGEKLNGASNPSNPPFPEFPNLPVFLKNILATGKSKEERDLLLIGTLTSISGCLPKVSGNYDADLVSPHLYVCVSGPSSSGKGKLKLCRRLLKPIEKQFKEDFENAQAKYLKDHKQYKKNSKTDDSLDEPVPPIKKRLVIPANNSSTGFFQLLDENGGSGMLFETEADTLTCSFKTDYGKYDDGLRKAFHHDLISYNRRTHREEVEIEEPRLAVVISGTPKQVRAMIPSVENGLFSRFLYFRLRLQSGWTPGLLRKPSKSFTDAYEKQSQQLLSLYNRLCIHEGIEILVTEKQMTSFDTYFSGLDEKYHNLYEDEFMSSVRRLGLITLRLAMVLTMLRHVEDEELPSTIYCADEDFQIAIDMVDVLVLHAYSVYTERLGGSSSSSTSTPMLGQKERFLEALPEEFSSKKYAEVADSMDIPNKTAQAYIKQWKDEQIIHHVKQGQYKKV